MRRILAILFAVALAASARADSSPPAPEGLLLRGFENIAAANRPGEQATLAGVLTTMRLDAAGELSATQGPEELAPLVAWYRARGQYYAAYADFAPGDASAAGFVEPVAAEARVVDLDGAVGGPNLFHPAAYDAILQVAKGYIDAGVDAIEYDTAWVEQGAGTFDAQTVADFRSWLNSRWDEATLQGYIDASYDDASFDYGAFLRAKGVTAANFEIAQIDGAPLLETKHWRLWYSFLRDKERQVVATLVSEANAYAQTKIGREIGFYFNRYGFENRPADRWFLSEYASGDLGETHFDGQNWLFHDARSLEPVLRANLKTFGKRFESWNHPPNAATATQSVFLAETIANNGVATWIDAELDGAVDTDPIARMARRYSAQLDHAPRSEAAIFYPLASALRNRTSQGGAPRLGGEHSWYLGLAYILKHLNVNYDVAFAGDGLAMPDEFDASDLDGYSAVFASHAIQTTDTQFQEILDYVNAGGTLIVSGADNFRYDVLGDDRSAARSYAGKTWAEIFGATGTVAIGAGEVKVVSLSAWAYDARNSPHLTGLLLQIIPNGFSAALPAGIPAISTNADGNVRVLRYLDESDNSETYQILNYTFNSPGTVVTPQLGFTLTLPEPSGYLGWPVAEYVSSADADPVALPITDIGGGLLQVTIPSLEHWGILRVGSPIENNPHPNLPPIAYFNRLSDYEEFGQTAERALVYSAADDSEVDSLQVHYQLRDPSTGEYGAWTAGETFSGFATNHLYYQTLGITLPGEGYYRLQLVATDNEGADSVLYQPGAYDTAVGYDSTPADRSALVITPNHGVADGGVIAEPIIPSFTFTGASDPLSGVIQYHYSWTRGVVTVASGDGAPDGPTTIDVPEIVMGEYGEYELTLRFRNGAGIWDESDVAYSLIYTIPPSYMGVGSTSTATVGDIVSFNLQYANTYGDIAIHWYKDGAPIDGADEETLNLGAVDADDSGVYTATIANPAGEIVSPEFDLTVITPLQITKQPSAISVAAGEPFTLTVEAEGQGALLYQWIHDDVEIAGATSASYSVASADESSHQGPYRVRIQDDITIIASSIATVTVTGGDGDPTPPVAAPSDLAAVDTGSEVALSWTDNSEDDTGFVIERRKNTDHTWTQIATKPANSAAHVDAFDIGAGEYGYRVKAIRGASSSAYSNIASVSREPITILIIVPGGHPIELDLEPGRTVGELRDHLSSEGQVPAASVRIHLAGAELSDDAKKLDSLGLFSGAQFTALLAGEPQDQSYASWQRARFGSATSRRAQAEDWNRDGIRNFVEYALGMEPGDPARLSRMLALTQHGETVAATYIRNAKAKEADTRLLVSVDQGQTWINADDAGFEMESQPVDDPESIRVTWTKSGAQADSILLRLEIEPNYED